MKSAAWYVLVFVLIFNIAAAQESGQKVNLGASIGTPGILNIDLITQPKDLNIFRFGFSLSAGILMFSLNDPDELKTSNTESDKKNDSFYALQVGFPIYISSRKDTFWAVAPVAGFFYSKEYKDHSEGTVTKKEPYKQWWRYFGLVLDSKFYHLFWEAGISIGWRKNFYYWEPLDHVSTLIKVGFLF